MVIKKTLLGLLLAFLFSCLFSEESLAKQLQGNAISTKPTYFHPEDKFVYLGEIDSIKGKLYFAVNTYSWGHDRVTRRLCVFDSAKKIIGDYYGVFLIPKVVKTSLVFTLEDLTWTIDFRAGVIQKLIVKGEIYEFERY